jgi:4a-hydroxytetrahydrobiopterin dehydratase
MNRLSIKEVENYLSEMKNWFIEGDSIVKNYVFVNFKEAMKFVNKLADLAEEMNHHPDIKIFNYRNVTVNLSTHSAGGVTLKDIELAKKLMSCISNDNRRETGNF